MWSSLVLERMTALSHSVQFGFRFLLLKIYLFFFKKHLWGNCIYIVVFGNLFETILKEDINMQHEPKDLWFWKM